MEREEIMKNVKRIFGNYVMIDHGYGEYSLLAHLKKGSLKVKTKDSGEGLPSYFRNLKLQAGDRWIPVPSGHIDTGDKDNSFWVSLAPGRMPSAGRLCGLVAVSSTSNFSSTTLEVRNGSIAATQC